MSDFQGAGQKPGLQVWRIEKMVPTIWEDHGKFCSGDSYIVLKTSARPGSTSLQWDIHFWLGKDTTHDEAGVAAYKTVELDDLLGGAPVQHREVQGSESEKFLSYFKGGVQYVAGGVESGFTKVVRDQYDTRLLQCKGQNSVRVFEVPVGAGSLNSGDVFILDCGLTIFQWNGKDANKREKAKALDVTTSIKNNERGGRAKVIVLDDGSETTEFWTALGGKGAVAAGDPKSDARDEKASADALGLYRAGDAEIAKVAGGPLKKEQLDTNGVFIVDAGNEVYVWVGKNAPAEERKNGMVYANRFLTQHNKSSSAKVTKVAQGGETPLFKEKFSNWTDMRAPTDFSKPAGGSVAKGQVQHDIDVSALLAALPNPADTLVDDGSGKLQIWRINKFEKEPIPADLHGQFYGGDSYIILYTYKQGTKECYIIYFWQGRNSSADEKGAAAILATKMDDELHGAATQVRVVQGKEPTHFLSLFKGSLIFHAGGTASGFKNKGDADSYDKDGVSLFHVKGTNALNTRAVQVAEKASSLNSGDSFLLKTPETVFAWFGKGTNADERAAAKKLAGLIKGGTLFKSVTEVEEGSETSKFWTFLGGKDDYPTTKDLGEAPREPRLFHVTNSTGVLNVEEIFDFSQDDLDVNDVFILDVWTEVMVWIGSQASAEEKKKGVEFGAQFVTASGRSADTPVVTVNAGQEPPIFTSAFLGWDAAKAQVFEDPYTKKLRLVAEQKAKEETAASSSAPAAAAAATPAPSASTPIVAPGSVTYSLEELKNKTAAGVDPAKREQYLSDAEFEKVFKMDKAKFAELKDWKKAELKKAAGLW